MKLTTVFSLTILLSLTFACGSTSDDSPIYEDENQYYQEEAQRKYYQGEAQEQYYEGGTQGNYTEAAYQNYSNGGNYSNPVHQQNMAGVNQNTEPGFQPVKDQTGAVIGYIPLPKSWSIQDQFIQGPNGTTVQNFPMVTDQQGKLTSVDQVIAKDIKPKLEQNGCKVYNVIDLPEVARCDQKMGSQIFQAMQAQNQYTAKGIEYTNSQGRKGLLVVHFINSQSNYGKLSMYTVNDLISNPASYQEAKQTYLYALAKQKLNPQYLARNNQQIQQQANTNWDESSQRIQNNQTGGGQNRTFNNSQGEANDIMMNTWNKRNMNEGHQKYIDEIRGAYRKLDPNTGQTFEAEPTYNNYYRNNNGQYQGANNNNYQPNVDPNLNQNDWRKAKKAPKRRW